jgi:hypothetical protein
MRSVLRTDGNDACHSADTKCHSAWQLLRRACGPLNGLFHRRICSEPDSGVGSLSHHLSEIRETHSKCLVLR